MPRDRERQSLSTMKPYMRAANRICYKKDKKVEISNKSLKEKKKTKTGSSWPVDSIRKIIEITTKEALEKKKREQKKKEK